MLLVRVRRVEGGLRGMVNLMRREVLLPDGCGREVRILAIGIRCSGVTVVGCGISVGVCLR